MKVLLLSAYAARSHVHWQGALRTMFPQWEWCELTLPPRHFSWRVRGNALYWSMVERERLEQDWDLLIATSMVDLATLRGLVPALARRPTVLYFHENQFAYPQDRQQYTLVEAQVTSIYSALAADRIVFNSHYNHDSFMAGCAGLLHRLPDYVPPEVVTRLRAKATVLPVPFDGDERRTEEGAWPGVEEHSHRRPVRVLWVGRFEHDKGADGLLRILRHLEAQGLDYELAMVGQQFRRSPPVFDEIRAAFGHRLVHFGYIESKASYRALLRAADVVLSTALHEFQGLAVMEAVAFGCLPIVPARMVYPELYPAAYCYASCPDEPEREAAAAAALIHDVTKNISAFRSTRPDLSAYGISHLAPRYAELLYGVQDAREG